MLEDITKDELDIYINVSDKLDNIINEKGIEKVKTFIRGGNNNNTIFNIYIYKILIILLFIGFLAFIWFNNYKNNNKTETKKEQFIESNKSNNFCYRTL